MRWSNLREIVTVSISFILNYTENKLFNMETIKPRFREELILMIMESCIKYGKGSNVLCLLILKYGITLEHFKILGRYWVDVQRNIAPPCPCRWELNVMRVSSPWLNYTQLWSKASTQLIQTGAAVAGSAVASVPRSDGDWVQLLPRWAAAPGSWPQHRTCTCPPHQAVPHLTTYHLPQHHQDYTLSTAHQLFIIYEESLREAASGFFWWLQTSDISPGLISCATRLRFLYVGVKPCWPFMVLDHICSRSNLSSPMQLLGVTPHIM